MPDHVHVLIQVQPTDTVAEVVQKLKVGTSYLLRKGLCVAGLVAKSGIVVAILGWLLWILGQF